MRKTKIICTIGPSSENEETLTQMCLAGMNVARLNFSHGTHEDHLKKITMIKKIREELGWEPQHSSVDEVISTAWKWHKGHPHGYCG